MSRYVIVGAGGIGVTFAAELQRAGREVVLVARARSWPRCGRANSGTPGPTGRAA